MSDDGTTTLDDRYAAAHARLDIAKEDPAGEIVRLAAGLIRLQSCVKVKRPRFGDLALGATVVTAEVAAGGVRQAAMRSGIEVLEGFAVSLIGEIYEGIERDAFHYLYQPIVSPATAAIEGYEALIRWQRGKETVTPALFLPLAEETRSIVRIQQRLLDDIAAVYARIAAPAFIGINCSPVQLSDPSAVCALIDRVAELELEPSRIVVEITERSAMVDPELARACALRLKERGFKIALDDFGSGYCSFAYLSELPIDLVKLDCSLIRAVDKSVRATVILSGIVNVAHKLGQRVIAEGVETMEQVTALRELGCDLVQGSFVGEPTRELGPPGR